MNYSSMQHYQGIPPARESIAGRSGTDVDRHSTGNPATPHNVSLQGGKNNDDHFIDEHTVNDSVLDQIRNQDRAYLQGANADTAPEARLSGSGQANRPDTFDPHAVWQMLLSELALQMPSATFNTWVRDTWVVAYEDGEFIIGLPNAYARDWLENRLRNKIKRALSSFIFRSVQVQFLVCPRTVNDPKDPASTPLYASVAEQGATHNQPHVQSVSDRPVSAQLAPHEAAAHSVSASNANGSDFAVPDDGAAYGQPNQSVDWRDQSHKPIAGNKTPSSNLIGGRPTNRGGQENGFHESRAQRYIDDVTPPGTIPLNGQYTFETFVVGSHNKLAHAAAEAIAEKPGQSFNPLFVYGGVGLGKTHLLHSVGHRAKQLGYRMLYVSSEQFTNELIGAIRSQSTEEFRNKYRQVDILLIDDIQFISGKESTQEEFFHTFNHLHASGRQVVLTSDRPPKMLATLDDRLRSRFEGGLQTDIAQPDFETRVAILQSKANRMAADVDHSVLMMVAERVDSNIRELEGALNRLIVQARLMQSPLTLQLATSILGNLSPERNACAPATLIRIVAEHFQLADADLFGRKRTKEIAGARQVAMYLLREEHGLSLPAIGALLGGRDHSTVRYGIEKVGEDVAEDEALRQTIATLREKIYLPL